MWSIEIHINKDCSKNMNRRCPILARETSDRNNSMSFSVGDKYYGGYCLPTAMDVCIDKICLWYDNQHEYQHDFLISETNILKCLTTLQKYFNLSKLYHYIITTVTILIKEEISFCTFPNTLFLPCFTYLFVYLLTYLLTYLFINKIFFLLLIN